MRRALPIVLLAIVLTGRFATAGPELPPELAGIPAVECRAGGNARMDYLLLGPAEGEAQPEVGYGLVVILQSAPGLEGDPQHAVLLRRLFDEGLPGRFVAAAPTPVRWTPEQKVLWPTARTKVAKQEFTTEDFVRAVVADVGSRHKLNPAQVFVLGWAESGPAALTVALEPDRPVTGAFVAMSDFSVSALPPLKGGKGAAFYFYHSPDDKVVSMRQATMAKLLLEQQGAKAELAPYKGGHGWQGKFADDVRRGIRWLQAEAVAPAGEGVPAAGGVASAGAATGPPVDPAAVFLYDGFEKGRVNPDGWRDSGVRTFGGQYIWDKKTAAEGKASLSLKGVTDSLASVGRWSRHLQLRKPTRQLAISVRIKAEGLMHTRVLTEFRRADNRRLGAATAIELGAPTAAGPRVDHDWQGYEGHVAVPTGASQMDIVFELQGEGQVWFDELVIDD